MLKIFGYKLVKEDKGIPEVKKTTEFLDYCLTQCNNQLRGVNPKAKKYNEEILEYWLSQTHLCGIQVGIQSEKEIQKLGDIIE